MNLVDNNSVEIGVSFDFIVECLVFVFYFDYEVYVYKGNLELFKIDEDWCVVRKFIDFLVVGNDFVLCLINVDSVNVLISVFS